MTHDASTEQQFESQRGRLLTIAHRILGSYADAEDAVQETWLRFSWQEPESIDNPAGWLTTVVGRICIDMLRARAARAEVPFGDGPPELVVADDVDAPEDSAVLADLVGIALLSVLGSLGPEERLAFVLHDMFAVPFTDIAGIVGKSADAAKMAASRARRKVRAAPTASTLHEQRAVVDAFLRAARDGDFDALLDVLAPDLRWEQHTARGVTVTIGATEVIGAVRRGGRAKVTARRVLVNGKPGIAAWNTQGKPLGIMVCTVTDGRLTAITSIADPARLATLDLPEP
ncbi:sigma-70 family RNA polymerase sigma factor [Mycolicibacterium vinylchloridicum]|uniref:sigma-70 family RNA polymerase sigma factor n=1 Tax=Mycolicibacterium vinylchloridicum TaxID=2736928 RepID=UPI0015C86576|nr:sigma-70 family RNA polymerase sigma factor [Mycolicibacterium vinylchloridicum]